MSSFLRTYQGMSEQVTTANKILPPKKSDIQSVLANLSQYAASSGVVLAGMTFSDSATSNQVAKAAPYQINYIEISMSASGTYPSFRAFLTQLENSMRIVDIHSIDLGSTGTANLEYKMVARVYYQN